MTLYFIFHALWSILGVKYILRAPFTPLQTWAWVLAMVISPLLATLFLVIFGAEQSSVPKVSKAPHLTRLQRSVFTNFRASLSLHNEVTVLHNANSTYTAIIRDLQRAREQIIFEYYIIDNDYVGVAILSLLCRRARAGVSVHIIYDSVGSCHLKGRWFDELRRSGVKLTAYGRLRFPYITPSVNRRNHRKLILIDGNILYVGGINIASRYLGYGKMGCWRDDHLRIRGEAAHNAGTELFALKSVAKVHRRVVNICPVQMAYSRLETPPQSLLYAFIEAVASARHAVRISTPYFLPPSSLLDALCSAARSGICVQIIVPSMVDVKLLRRASTYFLRRCVESGAQVYRYMDGFLHSKTVVIDNSLAIVGSVNMDYRSLYYNLEAAAFVYNRDVASQFIARFQADVEQSQPFATTELPLSLCDGVARMLAPLL